jgi:hypothetical protein
MPRTGMFCVLQSPCWIDSRSSDRFLSTKVSLKSFGNGQIGTLSFSVTLLPKQDVYAFN